MDDPRTEPLKEWNRLARENTEHAIASSMFEAQTKASEPMERFSTWLLVGTAAVASFLIASANEVIPFIGRPGFITCGAFLCVSCIFGIFSKIYGLQCQISAEVGATVLSTFKEHLAKYKAEEERINKSAEFWGITLETGVRMERILEIYYSEQPKLVAWLAYRFLNKHRGNRQIGHLIRVKLLNRQGIFAFLQSITFIGFLISGFIAAATA